MQTNQPTVFIVDDDQAVAESLGWLLESEGFHVESYTDAQAFLDGYQIRGQIRGQIAEPACLVLDIRMRGMSGLELQDALCAQGKSIPIIFITGHGDIPMAVRAMKMGAVDFLIKPFQDQVLLKSIHRALERDQQTRTAHAQIEEVERRYRALTPREKEVMKEVVSGKLNKMIASDLGIGSKTVEIHRSRIMKKMKARSLAELVKVVMQHGNL